MRDNVALVAGARGVIGCNLFQHLESLGGWRVVGLSRRGASLVPPGQTKSVAAHYSIGAWLVAG